MIVNFVLSCGHNLIAISGVGVAIAVKAALEKHQIPGKVVLLGTPGKLSPLVPWDDLESTNRHTI